MCTTNRWLALETSPMESGSGVFAKSRLALYFARLLSTPLILWRTFCGSGGHLSSCQSQVRLWRRTMSSLPMLSPTPEWQRKNFSEASQFSDSWFKLTLGEVELAEACGGAVFGHRKANRG